MDFNRPVTQLACPHLLAFGRFTSFDHSKGDYSTMNVINNLYQFGDDHPFITTAVAVAFFGWGFMKRKRKKTQTQVEWLRHGKPPAKSILDSPLFYWTQSDPFTIRDVLNSVLIFGRTGSGKTSSSGRQLMQAIVSNRQSGGLILAAKPEDADD